MMNQKSASRIAAVALLAGAAVLSAGRQTCAAQTPQANGPVLEERHPRYILQREDVLMLTFPLSTELNQTVTIQPDGYISLQSAGSVYAQGLTAPELAAFPVFRRSPSFSPRRRETPEPLVSSSVDKLFSSSPRRRRPQEPLIPRSRIFLNQRVWCCPRPEGVDPRTSRLFLSG